MKLQEFRGEARAVARDIVKPFLWSDTELDRWANEALREACRRSRLIVDSTDQMTIMQVLAGVNSYALDPRILFVRRVKLASRAQPLTPVHIADLDEKFLGWESDTGEPRHYIKDMDSRAIRLYPQSAVADTLHLTVVRLPLAPLKKDDDCPEIALHLHHSLVYWMLYRMYARLDAETQDLPASANNLEVFEAEFGKKSSAIDEAWIERQHGYIEAEGLY